MFERAGWCTGREVTPSIKPLDTPAYRIGLALLAEFEGLHVGECGAGRECACSDIEFDPADAEWLLTEFTAPHGSLCPIGKFCHGHGTLYIDANGSLHAGDRVGTSGVTLVAPMFTDGLVKLLLGYK